MGVPELAFHEKSIEPDAFCALPLSSRRSHISTVIALTPDKEPSEPDTRSLLEDSLPAKTTEVGEVDLVIPPVAVVPVALAIRSVQEVLPAV